MLALAHAWGGPVGRAMLRASAADFRVDEVLGFEPGGGGEHVWLWVRKQDTNSDDVARALARLAGVGRGAVGFSGMKDRRADAGQWFSVHLPGRDDPDWSRLPAAATRVVRAVRHPRKLRAGTHRRNRFALRLRAVTGDHGGIDARLEAVRAGGFPNYFGPQRFGRRGENLRRARQRLAGGGRAHGIHLSAARSHLFNIVLDARVRDGTWATPQPGDALMLAGSHSVFEYGGDDTAIDARQKAFDVDVTGPLWGIGRQPVGAAVAAREREWTAAEAELRAGIEAIGMRARRRPLRAGAIDLAWTWHGDALELVFTLPRGAFATSLVREIVAAAEPHVGTAPP